MLEPVMRNSTAILCILLAITCKAQQDTDDRPSQFPGGGEAMLTFIHCNLNYFNISEQDSIKPAFLVDIELDEKGKIQKVNSRDMWWNAKLDFDINQYRVEAIRVVEMMPSWIPAAKDQNAINSLNAFMIRFDPSEKSRCSN